MQYIFGADVGGTTVKMGFFQENGALLKKWELPTRPENGGSAILPDISRAIDGCLAEAGVAKSNVLGLGIGVPGPVDDDGNVNRCVNLNWGVFNLHQTMGRLTGLRIKAGNDANVAALGEFYDGGGKGSRSMLMVTIGTGVGGGFIWNGHILNGFNGVAGELGHLIMERDETERCTCGKCGCAEQYASARGMAKLAKKRLAADAAPSSLRDVPEITAKTLFEHASKGDRIAKESLDHAFRILGETIADACCMVDPELVLLGGGVSKAGDILLDTVQKHFRKYAFHASENVKFALATLENDAGIYGAVKMIL